MFNLNLIKMRKFTQLSAMVFTILCMSVISVFGQIPPEQEVVIIPPGENGIIETTINGDTLNGGRANPNRIYMLQKDAVYVMQSRILFGGGADTTSTLTIVGEEGGKKPIVVSTPLDDGDMFRHNVLGNLKLKNLYWPSMATNGTGNMLFELQGTDLRLEVEDFVGGNQISADLFGVKNVRGTIDVFIKNCYFRDLSKFKNPWNYAIIARGTRGIDSLWVENTTVANGGLLFLGTGPINFAYFNHNTIMNVPKYWMYFEQWKEAYFTNNIMINCNWQGESQEMMLSQKKSQKESPVPIPVGHIDIMHPDVEAWSLGHGEGSAPAIEDIKWIVAHNVNYTSEYLDKYYNGEYNDVGDYPISNIDWGFTEGRDGLDPLEFPHPVENVPALLFSAKTDSLIEMYDNIKADNNHDQVDPEMVTKMIRDQAHGDQFATWARNDYGVAVEGETRPDATAFTIGDFDATTVPGPEGENGSGFANLTELPEDFTYTADITSGVDYRKLGALGWYENGLDGWDSEAELEKVKHYYETGEGTPLVGISQRADNRLFFTLYPNPTEDVLNLNSKSELARVTIYDATGKLINQVELNGTFNSVLDISSLNEGMFLIEVQTVKGAVSTSKFIKK